LALVNWIFNRRVLLKWLGITEYPFSTARIIVRTIMIQLAIGSDVATGLIAPTCQMPNGEAYVGGMKLTFQRP
jgi:hypothetical protein